MQVTHRRHETDWHSLTIPFHRQPLHRRHRSHDSHGSNYKRLKLCRVRDCVASTRCPASSNASFFSLSSQKEYVFSGSGCRAATTPPRAAAERLALTAPFAGSLCAAGRGATRRSATSSTTVNRYRRRRGSGRGGRLDLEPLSPALSPLVPHGERGSLASTPSDSSHLDHILELADQNIIVIRAVGGYKSPYNTNSKTHD